MDRLIANLNTIWMGSYHLFANPVRFERPSKSNLTSHNNVTAAQSGPNVNVVKGSSPAAVKGICNSPFSSPPAMVLDDSCVVLHNFDSYVMGEVKQFSSIGNLRVLLAAEGFVNVKPSYLGGLWVLMELDSISSKTKLMKHVGVASWFSHLCDAQPDFVSKDHIVWVDIEGVPLNAWSRATFNKICARWSDVMDLEESNDGMFVRKRICIKTKLEENILEKFKIIVRGKVFVVRAKELFVWSPVFKDVEEMMYSSENESGKGDGMEVKNDGAKCRHDNSDLESDVDGVSDTVFGVQEDDLVFGQDKSVNDKEQPRNDKEFSSDPFNIYNLLNKKTWTLISQVQTLAFLTPPGFTLEKDNHSLEDQEVNKPNLASPQCHSEGFNSRVMQDVSPTIETIISDGNIKDHGPNKGGSILEVLDDMVKVGQAMGFSMGGCLKDMESIIGSQGDLDGLR
ncbi:hypothetical protein Tco_0459355 [Tanacetum coccineum]